MNKYFTVFFCYYILISCSTKQNQKDFPLEGNNYTIYLDGVKEESISLSSLFKNVQTIILETNDDCLIGRINRLQVFDGNIYILDSHIAKSLFVFDMEGKFIRKIGGFGQGPGEYIEVRDFTFDAENRIIFICDIRNRIHKYQLNGTYINSISIQSPDSQAHFIQFYNGKLYSNCIERKPNQNDYLLLEIDPKDGIILSRSLPKKYNKGWNELLFFENGGFFISRANNPPRINLMFMDYIISIGEGNTPYLELKSKNLTTEKDIESFRGKAPMPINQENILSSKKIFNVHYFIENNNFICFRCGFTPSTTFAVLFDKKIEEVKLFKIFSNDFIFKQDRNGWMGNFIFSDLKGAYEILDTQNSFIIDYFQNAIKNNEVIPDLDKFDQLSKLDKDSNPVIFYYEFK